VPALWPGLQLPLKISARSETVREVEVPVTHAPADVPSRAPPREVAG
jgi:hypothetical protein